MKRFDITIIGGGIVGMTVALLLAKDSQFKIALVEANEFSGYWEKEKIDHRVSAISLASQQIFQKIHVWEKIKTKRISSYHEMFVWDHADGQIHFDCKQASEHQLGFIIEDSVMRSSLSEAIKEKNNITLLSSRKITAITEKENSIELATDQNEMIQSDLIIGADGANSISRKLAAIEIDTEDYGHTAIVATVETEKSHQQTAWQRFLATGPLAFLPLSQENTSSIVWSTSPEKAKELLSQNDEDFCAALTQAFQEKLGKVTNTSKRFSFPLTMRHAKQYVKNRLALIGDAAHTIHPLAGQGVNLGLLDAYALTKVIHEALEKNRDYASSSTLRKYERERKHHNFMMLKMIGNLKSLFANESKFVNTIRKTGLTFTQKMPLIKNLIINYALGKSQI